MLGKLNFNTTQPLGGCLIGVVTHHSKATVYTDLALLQVSNHNTRLHVALCGERKPRIICAYFGSLLRMTAAGDVGFTFTGFIFTCRSQPEPCTQLHTHSYLTLAVLGKNNQGDQLGGNKIILFTQHLIMSQRTELGASVFKALA